VCWLRGAVSFSRMGANGMKGYCYAQRIMQLLRQRLLLAIAPIRRVADWVLSLGGLTQLLFSSRREEAVAPQSLASGQKLTR